MEGGECTDLEFHEGRLAVSRPLHTLAQSDDLSRHLVLSHEDGAQLAEARQCCPARLQRT